jgi:hypothetical protein
VKRGPNAPLIQANHTCGDTYFVTETQFLKSREKKSGCAMHHCCSADTQNMREFDADETSGSYAPLDRIDPCRCKLSPYSCHGLRAEDDEVLLARFQKNLSTTAFQLFPKPERYIRKSPSRLYVSIRSLGFSPLHLDGEQNSERDKIEHMCPSTHNTILHSERCFAEIGEVSFALNSRIPRGSLLADWKRIMRE